MKKPRSTVIPQIDLWLAQAIQRAVHFHLCYLPYLKYNDFLNVVQPI